MVRRDTLHFETATESLGSSRSEARDGAKRQAVTGIIELRCVGQISHAPDALRHPIEGAAGAAEVTPVSTSLAVLLARHVLRDGELVILILKPSLWFILLASMRFIALVLILMIGAKVFDEPLHYHTVAYEEAGVFLLVGRLMWAALQWTARLYILTDLRIIRISGVFNVNIFDCPLRKVARVRAVSFFKDKLFRVGTLEIIPSEDEYPISQWQTIARPVEVYKQVIATIKRAKQGGMREAE